MHGSPKNVRPFVVFPALPDVNAFFLKKVFVWVPELIFPGVIVPCPTCDRQAKSDGWIAKQPRRVFLEDDIGYLIGFRCVALSIPGRMVKHVGCDAYMFSILLERCNATLCIHRVRSQAIQS